MGKDTFYLNNGTLSKKKKLLVEKPKKRDELAIIKEERLHSKEAAYVLHDIEEGEVIEAPRNELMN